MKISLALVFSGALLYHSAAFEAISSYYGQGLFFFSGGPVGFAFSPQTSITITALGMMDDGPSDAQVTLWNTNGLPLLSVLVTTNSPRSNKTFYETIAPIVLSAGQTYYVSSFETNSSWWAGNCFGFYTNSGFTVGPGLSYMGDAWETNSDGTFPFESNGTNYFPTAANFLYVIGTTMTMSGLQLISGQVQIGFGVVGPPAASFTLLESDYPGGPWTTNLTAILTTNVPDAAYTFTTPPAGPVHFYKIQTP